MNMKKKLWILIIGLVLFPTIVFASSTTDLDNKFSIICFSLFISVFHMVMVIAPLLGAARGDGPQPSFKQYLFAFICNFILITILSTPGYIISFASVFLLGFPITLATQGVISSPIRRSVNENITPDPSITINGCEGSVVIRCAECNTVLKVDDKFCPECGKEFSGDNAKVTAPNADELALKMSDFDDIYNKSEEAIVKEMILEEMKTLGIDSSGKMIPVSEKTRLVILNIIFSILLFLYIGLIFYHVDTFIYFIGLIILIIFLFYKRKIDLLKYITKEVKARPNENIDNIIGAIKENLVPKKSIATAIVLPIIVIISSLIIFRNPIILYEKIDGGYAMRFYFTGWNSLTYASIPDTYKGEPVISLRGNAFSNMPFLKEVYLPDSITEIRGEAFKYDYSLEKVHLPANLKYLGGESFYKCYKLVNINLNYDTPLEEIKGNTFEECTSLVEIIIPDSVTRIGGHAFYDDANLTTVSISENSKLVEIGSSAFRRCVSLKEISIPAKTEVNTKAFKESPTQVHKIGEVFTSEDEALESFVISLYSTTNVDVPGTGKIYFNNYQYNSSKNMNTIKVTGYKKETFYLTERFKYKLNDYYYIELVPDENSSAVYGYIKAY